ncbi:hypothetical protein DEAC_c15120 [Desulfosporosinus acididurans]|uniref:Uncharacterized protein n=1 Tax=Desulfosporosinus acididurans TaxID=476652 RepID=A0A0J1FTQ0_9FIRM|nr:hypothetical protein [Desulfosporosinus acididurans]KLU66844.1 hypothetical protein DEAC_c15120 [Desulfosporosinus acididurans]
MRIKSFLQFYIKTFLALAAPFMILTFCRLLLQIETKLLIYGFTFAVIASFFLTLNLREVPFVVEFEKRREYLTNLETKLAKLGFTKKCTEGFLTIFENKDSSFLNREIKVYLFRDTALIITPKKYQPFLDRDHRTKLSLLFRYFA